MKKRISKILTGCVVLFLLITAVQLIVYRPVKFCKFSPDNSRQYIICEYVETTGFFWRIIGGNGKVEENTGYIKLEGEGFESDGCNIFSDDIYYGGNKYIFYGEFKENTYDEVLKDDDYSTFKVLDYDVLWPVKRLNLSVFKPLLYLCDEDLK
ncbi:MAG: hypothetical protein LIO44_00750 [Eubacterium sp.]|nr:hypothetical protein [Eubacterium sp.]